MSRVRIVTDSTSDIPPDIAQRLAITVVPAYVQVDNRSYRDDGSSEGLDRQTFYAQLPAREKVPTTAVPPASEFAAAYRRLSEETDEIVALVVACSLSGMYNVATLGAEEVSGVNVHVVDSGQVTMGLGWIVIGAAEAAAAGKSASEVIAIIEDIKNHVHVYAMLDTLEYLRRSGRVNWARAKAAQILRLKPIIEVVSGHVENLGQTRTRHRAIDRLIEIVLKQGPIERLAILHTQAPDLAEFRQQILAHCTPNQLLTVAVTTIIGTHVGPGGLGVATVTAR